MSRGRGQVSPADLALNASETALDICRLLSELKPRVHGLDPVLQDRITGFISDIERALHEGWDCQRWLDDPARGEWPEGMADLLAAMERYWHPGRVSPFRRRLRQILTRCDQVLGREEFAAIVDIDRGSATGR